MPRSRRSVGLAYYARAGQSSALVVVTHRWLTEPNVHPSRLMPACRAMLAEPSTMSADTTLTCRDCGQAFTFTSGEQDFYASRGFSAEPLRRLSARHASSSAMAAGRPTAATGRRHPMAVAEGATRRVAVARRVRCSRRPARVADSRPRCHSSPAATSRSIARPASSSTGAVEVTAVATTAGEGDSESLRARA